MCDNLVILAGGVSSRMRKSLETTSTSVKNGSADLNEFSKSMIKFGKDQKPFLDYLLTNVINAGYLDIVIVINNKDSMIRNYYEKVLHFKNVNITFAIQEIPKRRKKPQGTADALLQALKSKNEWSGQKFTVCNSDNLYSERALSFARTNQFQNVLIDYDHSALNFSKEKIRSFAILIKDHQGYLTDIIEKPSSSLYLQMLKKHGRIGVSMNLFSFDYNMIYPFLEKVPMNPERKEKEIPDAVRMMIKKYPKSVYNVPISEHVPDLTEKSDILNVEKLLIKQ